MRFAEPQPLELQAGKLFDLAVADYDRDGRLDLLTTNHTQASSVLRGSEDGRFTERIYNSGMHHDPAFPGLAALTVEPAQLAPGLYIYGRPGGAYEIRRAGDPLAGPVRGRISFRTGVRIAEQRNATVKRRRDKSVTPPVRRVEFELPAAGSRVLLDPGFLDVPAEVRIEPPLEPGRVFVGSRAVTPAGREFELRLPDRHGIAIADIDGDGLRDAWVVSGGNKGKIGALAGLVQDELFIADRPGHFTERRAGSGILKGVCRGRTAETPDYDGDGRLDLFASCDGAAPRLYRQVAPGRFRDATAGLRAAGDLNGSEYRWFDLTDDRRPELIVAGGSSLSVYAYEPRGAAPGEGGFRLIDRVRRRPKGAVRRLLVADFDADGDPDVFAASPGRSLLALGTPRGLRGVDPSDLGLPRHAATAAWADLDNDGRTDLYSVPQGVYRQLRDGSFAATGLAQMPQAGKFYAPTVLADFDADGDRDPLVAYKLAGELERPVRLLRNRSPARHWLQVDLRGRAPNTDALGAKLRLVAGRLRLTGYVGESESSRHSRGHHRVYFGLGRRARIDRLRVFWPDGSTTTRRDLSIDRLLRIEQ